MLTDEKTVVHYKIITRETVTILIEMMTGENQPYDHLYLNKCLIPFSANGDHNEVIQNDTFVIFFKHLLKMTVVNVKIQSQVVGQFLFHDMSLVIK